MLFACVSLAPAPEPVVEPVATTVVEPVDSGPEPFTLTWWSEYGKSCCSNTRNDLKPDGIDEPGDLGRWMIADWHAKNPQYDHVTIDMILAQYGEDAAVELDTMITAGETPNILEGFGGRWAGYRDIAIEHEGYMTEEMVNNYLPGRYEGMFVDGHIPFIAGVGAFYYPVVNVELFERAGVEVPDPWGIMTWEELEAAGEAIEALDDDSYLSCIFAGDPTCVQWTWIPFAGAGQALFADNDFSKVALNTTESARTLEKLVRFEKEGYLAPSPSGLSVFDCVDYFKVGKLAIFMSQLGSAKLFMGGAVEAGLLAEPFEIQPLLAMGTEDGVTPLILGGGNAVGAMVTDETPEEYREAAVSFAYYFATFSFADQFGLYFPYMQSQIDEKACPDAEEEAAVDYLVEHGFAECGFINPKFTSMRPLWSDAMAKAFLGLATPEQALSDFEVEANALFE